MKITREKLRQIIKEELEEIMAEEESLEESETEEKDKKEKEKSEKKPHVKPKPRRYGDQERNPHSGGDDWFGDMETGFGRSDRDYD